MYRQLLPRLAAITLVLASGLTLLACSTATAGEWSAREAAGWPLAERTGRPGFPAAAIPLVGGPARVVDVNVSRTGNAVTRVHWKVEVAPPGGPWSSGADELLEAAGFGRSGLVPGQSSDSVDSWLSHGRFTVHIHPSRIVPGGLTYDVVQHIRAGSSRQRWTLPRVGEH